MLDEWDTNYHKCNDGHTHGFRITVEYSYGTLTYWVGEAASCGGSLMAGPGTPAAPTRFAVRQAMQTSDGIVAALVGTAGAAQTSLGAQVRRYGITALEVDIPSGAAENPIQVTVLNPQGRVIRRFVTGKLGSGTQRVPWDGKNDRGEAAPAGVYVVIVQHGSFKHRTHFILPAVE